MIETVTLLGRMGRSSDVANLVEFLCSDQSSFISGNGFLLVLWSFFSGSGGHN